MIEFCIYCGAGIGKHRRKGEGTCPKCDSVIIYDPPSGWMFGFPKLYQPKEGESLKDTLIRDGYPEKEIDDTTLNHVRFIGPYEELQKLKYD